MNCDICGHKGDLVKANIEGVVMTVCGKCSSYGNVLKESNSIVVHKKSAAEESVVSNVGNIVRVWRENNGLTQEELGLKVNEKESLIRKIENGFIPSIELAKKLEKLIGIKLVEFEKFEAVKKMDNVSGFTIGDLLKK